MIQSQALHLVDQYAANQLPADQAAEFERLLAISPELQHRLRISRALLALYRPSRTAAGVPVPVAAN